jgi:hypothetical protein
MKGMSDSGGQLGFDAIRFVVSAEGNQRLADPHDGAGWDDHHFELPQGKRQNLLGNIAALAALVGLVAVWALQDSVYVVGFVISGLAFVAGAIALFLPGRRRNMALAGVLIGAFPFLFTLARFVFHF